MQYSPKIDSVADKSIIYNYYNDIYHNEGLLIGYLADEKILSFVFERVFYKFKYFSYYF